MYLTRPENAIKLRMSLNQSHIIYAILDKEGVFLFSTTSFEVASDYKKRGYYVVDLSSASLV